MLTDRLPGAKTVERTRTFGGVWETGWVQPVACSEFKVALGHMPTQAFDSSRRIRSIIDDELRPGVGMLLFSSSESGWPGFLFERRHVVEVGDATRLVCPVPRAVLIASGTLRIAYR
ncbi:MAG: hypothetical protein JWN85_4481, partial [Gammaproteobacteria bacterium]|nr:hypothetical protein [Gammaproteobacteria bacterium]